MDRSEHSGLRPLSPYGEGYCAMCHFIEGLTPDGRIERHFRSANTLTGAFGPKVCTGAYKKPAREIPYFSRKARFTTVSVMVYCEDCGGRYREEVPGFVPAHARMAWSDERCSGSGKLVRPGW